MTLFVRAKQSLIFQLILSTVFASSPRHSPKLIRLFFINLTPANERIRI